METIVLLGMSRYNFQNDRGEQIQGVTCQIVNEEPVQDPNKKGLLTMDMPGSLDLYESIHELPGMYRMEVGLRPGPKHKPIPTVVGLQYIGKAYVGPARNGTGAGSDGKP